MPDRFSTMITNRAARPVVLSSPQDGAEGIVREQFGFVTANTADTIGNQYRLCSVPSNARIISTRLWCAALGGSCAADLGVYYNSQPGSGAVIDADLFASAQSLVSAINGTEISNESAVLTIDERGMPLWKAAGLTADPNQMLDIVLTLTAVPGANGLVGVEVWYVE